MGKKPTDKTVSGRVGRKAPSPVPISTPDPLGKIPTPAPVKKGPGYVAGTEHKLRTPHNEKGGAFALLYRRKRVAEMYLKGRGQWEIADELGVDQAVIHADLKHIREQWLSKMLDDFDTRKSLELAKIDHIEERMWQAYERSCEAEVIRNESLDEEVRPRIEGEGKSKVVVGEEMVPVKRSTRTTTKQLIGDTRYIDQVKWCIEMRCKITGILKEKEGNGTTININWDALAAMADGDLGGADIEAQIRAVEEAPDPIIVTDAQTVTSSPEDEE